MQIFEEGKFVIKVLGICASPRNGNSKYLLEEALKAVVQTGKDWNRDISTEYYSIRGKKFGGCIACGACQKDGSCVIKDDFQELAEKFMEADVVIYSIPVYHMGMPAQLKAFIDRLGNSMFGRCKKLFPDAELKFAPRNMKTITCIAQGVHAFSGQEHTMTQIMNHSMLMGSLYITGDKWESYIGAGGWTSNDISCSALEKQNAEGLYDAKVALNSVRSTARRATEVAIILREGARICKTDMERENVYLPLLSRIQQ